MAREHARIWLDINADDDFERLPFDAQGFYTRVILTLSDLSYCGVADWRPRRLTTKAPDLTYERIQRAAWELEGGRYCLFDLNTEEVLARSFIRRDELLRNPKFAAAVIKAYAGIASKVLRAAVADEIRRVYDEHPEYSSWSHPDVGPALAKIMAKPGLDTIGYTPQITLADPVPIGNPNPVPITNPDAVQNGNSHSVPIANPVGNADSVPIPSTYTSTPTPAPLSGYVSGEPHQSDEPGEPPPPSRFCAKHPNGTSTGCRGCETARLEREAHDRRIASVAADQRRAVRAAIDNCDDCDEFGRLDDLSDCPNHPNFTERRAHA